MVLQFNPADIEKLKKTTKKLSERNIRLLQAFDITRQDIEKIQVNRLMSAEHLFNLTLIQCCNNLLNVIDNLNDASEEINRLRNN